MNNRFGLRRLLGLSLLIAMLLTPLLVAAQEEAVQTPTEAATAQQAPTAGLTILILLVGLGAVALVAGRVWLRDQYEEDSNT